MRVARWFNKSSVMGRRKVKILMLSEFFLPDLEYQENLAAKYLAKSGHDVVVVSSAHESVFSYYSGQRIASIDRTDLELPFGRLVRLPYRFNIGNKVRPLQGFAEVLEEEAPDMIFVHDVQPDLVVAANYVRKNAGTSLILDCHADYTNSGSSWLSRFLLHRLVRRRFYQKSKGVISRVFPVVPQGCDFLHELYGVPYGEMETLPLGADTDLISSLRAQQSRKSLRAQFGFSEEDFVIFSGGKLERRKRFEVLIDAVQLLDGDHIQLRICGDGADSVYRQSLRELADRDTRTEMMGWLDTNTIYRLMLASDVSVFPASQSILWQRSIACGLPLICGDVGGQSPDYLNQGNIVVLPVNEILSSQIAATLQELISDPRKLRRMRRLANHVARESLDWNILGYRIAKLGPS